MNYRVGDIILTKDGFLAEIIDHFSGPTYAILFEVKHSMHILWYKEDRILCSLNVLTDLQLILLNV